MASGIVLYIQSGIERIIEACKSAGTPEPQFKYDGGGLWTTFFFSKEYQEGIGAIESRPETDQEKQKEAIIELIIRE